MPWYIVKFLKMKKKICVRNYPWLKRFRYPLSIKKSFFVIFAHEEYAAMQFVSFSTE